MQEKEFTLYVVPISISLPDWFALDAAGSAALYSVLENVLHNYTIAKSGRVEGVLRCSTDILLEALANFQRDFSRANIIFYGTIAIDGLAFCFRLFPWGRQDSGTVAWKNIRWCSLEKGGFELWSSAFNWLTAADVAQYILRSPLADRRVSWIDISGVGMLSDINIHADGISWVTIS